MKSAGIDFDSHALAEYRLDGWKPRGSGDPFIQSGIGVVHNFTSINHHKLVMSNSGERVAHPIQSHLNTAACECCGFIQISLLLHLRPKELSPSTYFSPSLSVLQPPNWSTLDRTDAAWLRLISPHLLDVWFRSWLHRHRLTLSKRFGWVPRSRSNGKWSKVIF